VRWDGDSRQKSFSTEKEATEFQAKLTLGIADELAGESFGAAAERWIARRNAAIWKADVVPSRPVSALLSVLRRGQAPRATGQDL
jgi:hypothetical protein